MAEVSVQAVVVANGTSQAMATCAAPDQHCPFCLTPVARSAPAPIDTEIRWKTSIVTVQRRCRFAKSLEKLAVTFCDFVCLAATVDGITHEV